MLKLADRSSLGWQPSATMIRNTWIFWMKPKEHQRLW